MYVGVHTVKSIVLVNATKAIIETINADGTVNASNIKPFSLIACESETPYDFELNYSVTNFATKEYVDGIIGNLEILLGGI